MMALKKYETILLTTRSSYLTQYSGKNTSVSNRVYFEIIFLEFQLDSVIFLCGWVIEDHMQNLRSLVSKMADRTASEVY